MFWIHGGAFTGGTGADPTFDGGNMASRGDVVMVTINYRLSTLGFLALDDGKTNGNFGIADIITALEWVNEHISSFGGDPDRITIFGQSAGAAAVRTLLGSPKAIGKYAGAIQMSNLAGLGYATTYSLYDTIPQEVATVAEPIMQSVNCTEGDVLACLKAVDGNTLVNLPTVARFVVVDGTFVTHDELILDGTAPVANVHHMMGFMRDDGAAFISNPTTSNLMLAVEDAGLPGSIATSPLFPMPNISTNALDNVFNVTARGATDGLFRCLDQATAVSAIQHNLFKSMWFYEFNRSYQTPGFDPNAPRCDAPVDATHPNGDPDKEYYNGELFYVFGNLPSDLPLRDDKDLPFMQMQLDTWTSFARTFNPNPEPAFLDVRGYTASAKQLSAQEEWVAVSKSNINTKPLRQLEWPSFMTEFKEQSQCSFLNFSLNSFG
ncbi:hypothetical protein EW026_g1621 [Hermanssonia centrifuga]|uniref:Carboxylic ester hydrolase n=1 Tax=Hermanssonia centrifuga TaxID=98765 RepID=A0A4S4KQT5_9APHY|nr:hypothetical protein EW026_g1621 [Hermanssonia centrifuga]